MKNPATTGVRRWPRRMSETELKKFGITLTGDPGTYFLQCDACGLTWQPSFSRGMRGGWARGYWKCPKGCNAPE